MAILGKVHDDTLSQPMTAVVCAYHPSYVEKQKEEDHSSGCLGIKQDLSLN
jgi:hypothetical protein